MQDRAELFRPQLIERMQLKEVRREEVPVGKRGADLAGVQQHRLLSHALRVSPETGLRRLRDHRSHIGGDIHGSPMFKQRMAPISISRTRSAISS